MFKLSNLSLIWLRFRAINTVLSCGIVLSGCAPWKNEVYSNTKDSMLLQRIHFESYKNGEFKMRFKNQFSAAKPRDKSKIELLSDEFIRGMGSIDHLSADALKYLEQDQFICNKDSCEREFYSSYVYGTAIIPFGIQAGFAQEAQSKQIWKFIISRSNVNGNFTSIIYSE